MIGKTIINKDVSNKKWFELLDGIIKEAEWEYGSVFISGGLDEMNCSHNFIIHENKKARYCFANSEKNARRIFHRLKLI